MGPAVAMIVLAPALMRPGSQKPPFVEAPLDALGIQQPDYVFVGNSMLGKSIDPGHLSELTGGGNVFMFRDGGSASALWYLQIKNYLIPSKTRPKTVFLFFRDHFLTEPKYRITGHYRDRIDRASLANEVVLEEKFEFNSTWRNRADAALMSFYPIQKYSRTAQKFLKKLAVWPLSKDGQGPSAALGSVNAQFDLNGLRPTPRSELAPTASGAGHSLVAWWWP